MPHDHTHEEPQTGRRLAIVIALNFTITLAEVIGGLISGSLSLISDALHNFSDGVAVIIAWIAIRLQGRPRTDRHTFGLKRAEIIAAVINSGTLVAISLYLFVEAAQRFRDPQPIAGALMVAVALIGLVANVVGTLLLRRGADNDLNLRAAYLHLLSDAVSSVGVIVGGIAITLWNIAWIDPLLTVLIGVYVLKESLMILWHSLEEILLASPTEIDLEELRAAIAAQSGVSGVHHIHLWQLAAGDIHFEAHIDLPDQTLCQADRIRAGIEGLLHDRFAINHATLQVECNMDGCDTRTFR